MTQEERITSDPGLKEAVTRAFYIRRPLGCWHVGTAQGGITFSMFVKPSWRARLFARWLLDWRWEDAP